MKIYQLLNDSALIELNEKPFNLERELQKFFENNLTELTGYKFITSEFSLQDNRIDTLAFDEKSNSFVIIEYKNHPTKKYVLGQCLDYEDVFKNNKYEVLDKVNKYLDPKKNTTDFNWQNIKINGCP